jgi:NhaA family Na+:H+ antiporter
MKPGEIHCTSEQQECQFASTATKRYPSQNIQEKKLSGPKIFHPGNGEDDKHAYRSPLENKIKEIITPFQQYIKNQVVASILLAICTLAALIWACIPAISNSYTAFTAERIGFHISSIIYFSEPLKFWVNDFLLTLFFFFVGLEIKREFLVGELADRKKALFVVIVAMGGMAVPAGLYYFINSGTPQQIGWGIPMATDTAFALGVLACFKNRVPKQVVILLAALAVIDDIGSILVIAIFYSDNIITAYLLAASALTGLLILFNYSGFRKPWPYLLFGIAIWFLVEKSGIHGSIAGIITAFIIPARPEKGPKQFIRNIKNLLIDFEQRKDETALILKDGKQHDVLQRVQTVTRQATTPLQRWENKLELPVALVILPLFALVNAGVAINSNLIYQVFTQLAPIGIIVSLTIGKPLGILFFSRLAVFCRIGSIPSGLTIKHLIGPAILSGIGFTMSLFISTLSFDDNTVLLMGKTAILIASVIAAILGITAIFMCSKKNTS